MFVMKRNGMRNTKTLNNDVITIIQCFVKTESLAHFYIFFKTGIHCTINYYRKYNIPKSQLTPVAPLLHPLGHLPLT